jgi:hypothetical protein
VLRRYPGDIAERHPEKLMRSIRFFARTITAAVEARDS